MAAALSVLAAFLLAAFLLAGCSASAPARRPASAGDAHSVLPGPDLPSPATPTPAGRPRRSPGAIPGAPHAGRRPQTRASPSAHAPAFRAAMTDLWMAVRTGKPRYGRPAFFPLAAYTQVKAIPAPSADWHHRLFGDFRLDVAAAHDLLGASARKARLVRVIVPAAEASWINPGVCDNSIGYWHAAGARVVYREAGRIRSFGIASLISWRGVWYVVHFGAVLRSSAAGVVDQPATGTGVAGPPGGC